MPEQIPSAVPSKERKTLMEFEDPFKQEEEINFENPETRLALAKVFADPALDAETALELLADLDLEATPQSHPEQLNELIASYGLNPETISEQDKTRMSVLKSGAEKGRSTKSKQELAGLLDGIVGEQLFISAIKKIDKFSMMVVENENQPEVLKSSLIEIMKTMGKLADHIPPEQAAQSPFWDAIYQRFKLLVERKTSSNETVSKIYNEVFYEYGDVVDKRFIPFEYQQQRNQETSVRIEDLVSSVYGRSEAETEDIKTKNRVEAVNKIAELASKETFSNQDILDLMRTNNKGLLPEQYFKFRSEHEEGVTFGKRIGILPEDIAQEMGAFEERVQKTIAEAQENNWSKAKFEIAVAQLHNNLLDIHPFPDRNGSTSVLFMELMMARRGYQPKPKREKNYYKNVTGILGYNPVAVGILGYGMYRQANEYGYYKGVSNQSKEQKDKYEAELKNTFDLWKNK